MRRIIPFAAIVGLLFATVAALPAAAEINGPQLRAGAARVNITPSIDDLPPAFVAIHDDIYVRALVLESGPTRAIIVVADVPMIHATFYDEVIGEIAQDFSVPAEYIVLGTTHTHSSLRVAPVEQYINIPNEDELSAEEIENIRQTILHRIPVDEGFNARVVAAIYESVHQAQDNLAPARAGYAAGNAVLVASRNEWLPSQHRIIDGIDRSGTQPVDHTLGVHKFESLTGKPIALLLNYGIEPVVMEGDRISGDVPGAASRYLEQQLGEDAVAIFTIGAPESPLYRVWSKTERAPETAATIMNAMGVILGEEALASAAGIGTLSSSLAISADQQTLRCPGKITTPRNLRNHCAYTENSDLPACEFSDRDVDPVDLAMGLLRIGDVAYVLVNGNVVPALSQKLRQASPLANTLVMSTVFGPLRFVVDDAAYPLNTYPATDTRAKQGCAEQGLLNAALDMIKRTR